MRITRPLHAAPFNRPLLAILMLCVGPSMRAAAQAAPGTVEGLARSDETDDPIPFSLVRLRRAGGDDGAVQQGITNSVGRFRFAAVIAGDYRLELLRIGYRPVLSPVLHVRPAEMLRYDIRGAVQPVQLPVVVVRAGRDCIGQGELADDPQLLALWNETRKGIEVRRAFELRYRFTQSVRQDVKVKWRLRRDSRQLKLDTLVNEPDSVLALEQRQFARRRAEGYGRGNLLVIPNEKELFDDDFLRSHCLETSVKRDRGALGVLFRPSKIRSDGIDIRGTVWLDSATYLVRRIEYQHLDGNDPFGQVAIEYADVAVAGTVLRLPLRGSGALLHMRGPARAVAGGATATLAYTYGGFEEVPLK